MSIFNSVPVKRRRKTRFNMTHEVKTTVGFGKLVPYMIREVLPGDVWNVSSDFMCRFSPMLAPIMHNVSVRTECFFVPNRLLWRDWESFITGGENGTAAPIKPIMFPNITSRANPLDFRTSSLWDYLGLPSSSTITPDSFSSSLAIDLMPFLAYQIVWQEYYRDQNLQTAPIDFPITGGNHSTSDFIHDVLTLRSRCYEKDYFTGSLPFTQRGPQASVSLTGDAPVNLVNNVDGTPMQVRQNSDGALITGANLTSNTVGQLSNATASVGNVLNIDPNGRLAADLSSVSAITMNDLRRTSALQRFLENMARGGSRYIEQILSQFGVISSDSRLQRPEYLGGGSSPCIISEVLQTSETASTPQANMAGHGVAGGVNHGCLRRFEEHGFIVCLVSIRPRTSYLCQGVETMFRRFDKFEYAWPELAHLGEQPVYSSEIYCGPNTDLTSVFGYVPRYADWKYILSKTTGEFRETMTFWHLSRYFASQPVLSSEFVTVNQSDADRIFAGGTESENQQVYLQILNKVSCTRLLPKYGVPMLQ